MTLRLLLAFTLLAPPVLSEGRMARVEGQDHGHVVETPPLSPAEQLKKFHLPPGFEIQLVAAEPDIVKPMNLAFDDLGNLLASQSYEYPFPAKPDAKPRDTIKRFSDFGPDGRARRVTTLAEGLNIPIGITTVGEQVIAHSIPSVWKILGPTDKDRDPLYGEHGYQDTHGMLNAFTPWVDGWIYACHGFANKTELRAAVGPSKITMHSGNTWRMKPDGTKIEIYSNGQVNPFGACFDPMGNFFTSDCHSKPAFQVLRGGWYPTFDGRHDGLGQGPAIMNHIHGSTGIAGIVYYAADHFPAEWRNTLFIGNPITHRINHDKLETIGATYKAVEQKDFLKCDDPWFRPVDLKLAPDGSLYVADFYTCIIGHYEVPLDHPKREKKYGRIWRIVHTGSAPKPMPVPLFKMDDQEVFELLKDENLTVRVKATNHLAMRTGPFGKEVKRLMAGEIHPYQRAHGLWILERQNDLDETLVRKLAADSDRLVRVHLVKALAERAKWTFEAELVRERLKDEDAWVRRAAAEALGLHPDAANVRPLLAMWAATPAGDTHLTYQARIAVRNQLLEPGVYDSLGDADPDRIANVSLGARTPESAKWLLKYLQTKPLSGPFLHHMARYIPNESLAAVFDLARNVEKQGVRERLGCLQSLHQGVQERGATLPEAFVELSRAVVRAAIDGTDRPLANDALKFARDLKIKALFDDIAAVASTRERPWDVRAAALDALAALDGGRALPAISKTAADPAERADLRLRAVAALGGMNSAGSRAALVNLLKAAPQQAAVGIATALAASKEGADALLTAIAEGKASPRLLLERSVDGRLKASKPSKLEERVKKLTADLPPEDDRIKKLIDARRTGFGQAKADAGRGAEVFKKSCSGCHVVAGVGKKVGPELDGIAHRGLDRILEDVLDPNRAVDQAFRATMIKTTDGRVLSGLVLREEGEVLVIQEAADKETRLPKKDVEQRQLSQLSPMPANVIEPMPEAEFYDLVAFLLAQRPK